MKRATTPWIAHRHSQQVAGNSLEERENGEFYKSVESTTMYEMRLPSTDIDQDTVSA